MRSAGLSWQTCLEIVRDGLSLVRLIVTAITLSSCHVFAQYDAGFDDDVDNKPWREVETQLPLYPQMDKLIGFYVSPTTSNRFFIDPASLSLGADDEVRYILVIKTQEGATNVSFEGIRCATRERRLYAFGQTNNTWSRARKSEWVRFYYNDLNRQHAILSREYFCPGGVKINSAAEGVSALRSGGHPDAK